MKIYLQPHNNRIQIQHRLPVLTKNVQADVPLKVDVRVVDLVRALDLWWLVGEVRVDGKGEFERSAFVHT